MVLLGLYNTYPGLILTHMVFTLPYAIIMMTAYFNTLPRELDEAVKVDGAIGLDCAVARSSCRSRSRASSRSASTRS